MFSIKISKHNKILNQNKIESFIQIWKIIILKQFFLFLKSKKFEEGTRIMRNYTMSYALIKESCLNHHFLESLPSSPKRFFSATSVE